MLKQELNLKLQQKLSPQQIQLMKLVQLPTVAFEQRVKEELEENPALDDQSSEYDEDYGGEQEEWDNQGDDFGDEQVIDTSDINIDDYLSDDDIPNYKTYTNNYSDDDEDKSVPYAQGESFIEFLTSQLYTNRLTSEQFQIAEFILGNIDDDGYMRRDIKSLVDDLAFSQNIYTSPEEVENLLINYIQRMDPVGVGARDLQECLLIQLENKNQTEAVELAEKLISESFDAFTKKHYSKLMAKYDA
ncbi:MAG TPA: RNA polymerase sigma-54 factor, partial [Flavobacteriaceae bacterium]|nr:RNA polymerase sigma-54 factor [Flavobacteriaceae bacterium]